MADITTIHTNLLATYQSVESFGTGLGFVIGFGLIGMSVMKLRRIGIGDDRERYISVSMYFLSGILAMYLGQFIFAMSATVMQTSAIPAYSAGSTDSSALMMEIVLRFVQVIGLIAVLRGVLLLRRIGEQPMMGQQQRMLPVAITHMIGGLLLMHIDTSAQIIGTAFDIQLPI